MPASVRCMSEQPSKHKLQRVHVRTDVRTAHLTIPTGSTCSHKCSNNNAMTTNGGRTLCNRPDALQQNMKIAAYRPDAQCSVWTPPMEIRILIELDF
jgi:hypothetical protein